jgi:hypothetical protein
MGGLFGAPKQGQRGAPTGIFRHILGPQYEAQQAAAMPPTPQTDAEQQDARRRAKTAYAALGQPAGRLSASRQLTSTTLG